MDQKPSLDVIGIDKSFGSVRVLNGANLRAFAGSITALVGDNGAGKSTLIKIIAGVHPADSGEIFLDGKLVSIKNPKDAQMLGIEVVYQDLSLAPHLSAIENLFLGRFIYRQGRLKSLRIIDHKKMRVEAEITFKTLGTVLKDIEAPVLRLSGGQRQSVAVCKAARWGSRLVILDEPTASLGHVQTENVMSLIRRIADQGKTVIIISHNLPQVIELADQIEVLRHGVRVASLSTKGLSVRTVIDAMMGAQEGD